MDRWYGRGAKAAAIGCAALLVAASGPRIAAAQSTVDATVPEEIMNIARGFGSASLETDSQGDPKVSGRIDGVRYNVFFYDCTDNKACESIQFSAAWRRGDVEVPLAKMNEWNRSKRYGVAFLDNEEDPVIQMDVNLEHGVTRRNLDETFRLWTTVLSQFESHVGL